MTSPDPTPASNSARPRKPRRWLAAAALAGAFLAGAATTPIVAIAAAEGAMHGAMGPGGMHAMAQAHIQRMLDEVGASADQKARIDQILHQGFQPMADLHHQMADTHKALHALLAAPTIDRAAIEQLRAAQIARLDQASRAMTSAMADAAEVLTPDQRAKLATLGPMAHGAP